MLCAVSEFIDAALSVGMAEKETRVIHMHDFTPAIFKRALQLVLDPLQNRRYIDIMRSRIAVQLLPFYDFYGFDSGRKICDEAIARDFKLTDDANADECREHWNKWWSHRKGLDLLLTATILANEKRLPAAGQITRRYVNLHMCTFSKEYKIDHIRKLHPMLKNGHFLAAVQPATFSQDELDSSLFPKLFLTLLKTVQCQNCWSYRVRTCQHSILVEGAGVERVNGRYTPESEPILGYVDAVYVRTLDDGLSNELYLDRSQGDVWTLRDSVPARFSVTTPLYRARPLRCEGCRLYPPLERCQWMAVRKEFLPVPKFRLLNDDA
jgi:hypothetical protein